MLLQKSPQQVGSKWNLQQQQPGLNKIAVISPNSTCFDLL